MEKRCKFWLLEFPRVINSQHRITLSLPMGGDVSHDYSLTSTAWHVVPISDAMSRCLAQDKARPPTLFRPTQTLYCSVQTRAVLA